MALNPTRLLVLCAVLSACSDYEITAKDDNPVITEDTGQIPCPPQIPDCYDSDPPESEPDDTAPVEGVCPEFYAAGEDLLQVEACYVEEQTGTFTPVVEYRKSTWAVDPSSNNIMMMPAVASLTDDNSDGVIDENDIPDIIVITYGSYGDLRAVSGDGSREIFNITNASLQGQGAVAVGDIDGDGLVEIIAPTANGLSCFENDGTLKWTSAPLSGHMYGTSDMPAISDMDHDGNPEIIVGRAILNNDGTLRGAGRYGMGATQNVGTTSFAVDIDNDGTEEVVTGNALYDPDGNTIWYNNELDGYVAVADFDADGKGDIVVMRDGNIRLQDENGTVLWRNQIANAGTYYGGAPTIADFDGDGEPEVGVAGRSNYTVFDTNGTKMWERTTQDFSSGNTGSSVFDFEGDGIAEAVYADETSLWVFSGPDGTVKLQSTEHSNATWTEYPVIADVDADGVAEIVVANTNYTGHTGFYVFGDANGSWREGRRIWNQHAYSITNVNDDGTIPVTADLNWLRYNNFRSGDITAGTGGTWPDLVVVFDEFCDVFCDDGRIFVWGRVGNQGYVDAEAGVEVTLWAETPQGRRRMTSQTINEVIPAGRMLDSFQFEVSGLDGWDIRNLVLTVDGGNGAPQDGAFTECDETNNEDDLGYMPCL